MSRHTTDNTQLLIFGYLSKYGYTETLKAFEAEVGRTFDPKTDFADDLQLIIAKYNDQKQEQAQVEQKVDPIERSLAALRSTSSTLPLPECGAVLPIEHGGNILAIATSNCVVSPFHETGASAGHHGAAPHAIGKRLLATSAATRMVHICTVGSWEKVVSFSTAPTSVVGLSFHPTRARLLAMGSLSGAVTTVDALTGASLQAFSDHTKYVNAVAWAPRWDNAICGHTGSADYLVATSHDRTVSVYAPVESAAGAPIGSLTGDRTAAVDPSDPEAVHRGSFGDGGDVALRMGHALRKAYVGVAERVCWLNGPNARWVAIVVRDDSKLHYLEAPTGEEESYSLNANGDEHVGFSPVDVRSSPCGRFVSVLTDNHRVIVYGVRSSVQYATLFGPTTGVYYQCAHSWLPDSRTIAVASSDGHVVLLIDVPSGRTVKRLAGHTHTVRDLTYDAAAGCLFTVSYDKCVRAWVPTDVDASQLE